MIKRGNLTTKIKNVDINEAINNNLIPNIKATVKYKNNIIHILDEIPSKHRCILGTFTDYLIRKIIHDIRGDDIKERLICETVIKNHQNYPYEIDNKTNYTLWRKKKIINERVDFCNLIKSGCEPSTPNENTNEITYTDLNELNRYKQYIENYKKKQWFEVLNDIWELSLLDSLLRSRTYVHTTCYNILLDKDNDFYRYLIKVANYFSDKNKKIFYNPTLGRKKNDIITGADADLIYDDELIDWKCTKKKDYTKDILQTLMYSGLSRESNYNIKKCSIHYLLFETKVDLDIKNWDETEFMEKYCI